MTRRGAGDPPGRARHRGPGNDRWRGVLLLCRLTGYLVALVLIGISAFLGVAAVIDQREPVYWGKFTEEDCEPARYGCQSIGTWISDDQTTIKHGVYLDGSLDSDGTARASYKPTGIINDLDNNIVHTEGVAFDGIWIPWVLCLFIAGYALDWAGKSGDLHRLGAWRTRRE